MNKEKAKQILESWLLRAKGEEGRLGYIEGWFYEEDEKAFDLAIEALGREIEYGQMVVDFTKGETMKSDEWKYDTTCVAESATTTDCISRTDTVNALCRECRLETKCGGADCHENWCTEVAVVMGMPPVNQKQVTGKLNNPDGSLLTADSDECKEQKSKLESAQMREYIPKDEVLNIIKSMPMDLVAEYVYELDGIWLDDDFTPTERTGEWIPVSERLPDYRQTVLVSTKWGVNIAFRDSIIEGVTDDFWDCPSDDSTIASIYVTAWQPLPEPYKGGDM